MICIFYLIVTLVARLAMSMVLITLNFQAQRISRWEYFSFSRFVQWMGSLGTAGAWSITLNPCQVTPGIHIKKVRSRWISNKYRSIILSIWENIASDRKPGGRRCHRLAAPFCPLHLRPILDLERSELNLADLPKNPASGLGVEWEQEGSGLVAAAAVLFVLSKELEGLLSEEAGPDGEGEEGGAEEGGQDLLGGEEGAAGDRRGRSGGDRVSSLWGGIGRGMGLGERGVG